MLSKPPSREEGRFGTRGQGAQRGCTEMEAVGALLFGGREGGRGVIGGWL